jgi:DNA-binding GntR family transcriptional regulator
MENLNPVEQRYAIVEAIAKGDASGACEAMRTLLRQILFDLPAMAELRLNYFEKL